MDRSLETVLQNANCFEDKLQAYTTKVFADGTRHRLKEAPNIAFYFLGELGETFPDNPGFLNVMVDYIKTRRLLSGKSDRFFFSLPAPKKLLRCKC